MRTTTTRPRRTTTSRTSTRPWTARCAIAGLRTLQTPTPQNWSTVACAHRHPPTLTHTVPQVHTVSSQLDGARRRLTELQDEQRVIERYHSSGVQYDYGPGDAFASLAGRCLSDTGARWTYEACFFDKATQNEPHNPSNRVSLGTWSHWSSNYTQAVFANGDACSGGVTRSLTVKLVCEESERMWGGEEPSMCTYTVWFATPLACQHQDLQQVRRAAVSARASQHECQRT